MVKRESYDRVVVLVETGYQSEVHILRFNTQERLGGLSVSDGVAFTGAFVYRDGVRHFALDTIVKQEFEICGECRLPSSTTDCPIKHNQHEVQLISGQWKLVHRDFSRGRLNMLFEKDGRVLAFSSSPKLWFHKILDNLEKGKIVNILGWKRKEITELIFVSTDCTI